MNNNSNATDLSRRSSRASPRTRLSISEHRRPPTGTNSNLSESEIPPAEHRSSLSHALRTSSPTIGGSPVIATGDPHHQRAPSLGELHQELEQEQEAQVNRLLQMIRSQQAQLQQLQQQQQQQQSGAAVEDSTPPSERSAGVPIIPPLPAAGSGRTSTQFPSSLSSHRASRPSSQTASPSLRPLPSASLHGTSVDSSRGPEGLDLVASTSETSSRRGSRDEVAFYQAEASMLNRENQMLRQRIRELGLSAVFPPSVICAKSRHLGLTTSGARPEQNVPPATQGTETADQHASAGVGPATEPTNKS
ncbi:hypothetical protein KXW98_002310 [Aspergillus fumigatus]|nr:hypothetical protein KXX45_004928 [Aspergillus fumigatus]KMK61772.1 hypothetical protein Y699_02613 [Aspergillus fumigatus Z5]KAH1298152.1 hypothetical protein KXX48_005026 [Aspergillus fumigatus]KAH1308213.1 hypothetical protein KXX11_006860 [Aspergillus fumigatus]KAH1365559.1 hypothetical protein KXX33_000215 [Aspergillus fumigatus]